MKTDNKKQTNYWIDIQDEIASQAGLGIVTVDGDGLNWVSKSNDNSICQMLVKSKTGAKDCQRFCGKAYSSAVRENRPVKFKCHAGLECIANVINPNEKKKLVAITGRVFTKASDYREATERAVSGKWKEFPPTQFFENILLTSSRGNIEKTAARLSRKADGNLGLIRELLDSDVPTNLDSDSHASPKGEASERSVAPPIARLENPDSVKEKRNDNNSPEQFEDAKEFAAWAAFFAAIHDLGYGEACIAILKFLAERYGVSSMAWLENVDNQLKKALAVGGLKDQKIRISLRADDKRLLRMFKKTNSVELREQTGKAGKDELQSIRLFPIVVSGRIRSALVLDEKPENEAIRVHISRFCQLAASELEIIRLRQELIKQSWLDKAFTKINKSLTMIDSSHFWLSIMQTAADLVNAGRGSLLVYDEKGEDLVVRAAIGRKADFIEKSTGGIGERIAKRVWKNGRPLVVADIGEMGFTPAPIEWEYRTASFISYPLSIGKRRVGVLNVTDKNDDGVFDKDDLKLLKSIAPQLSVAIDRATLKSKAGEFEQLSVTDPLTGLLNRRYLEERLTEEIKRSDRHGYPMSFLMIDVDEFKSYNDTFTHPEGDKALQIVGQCLRESLRDADVAARYGGEEFSILLPQTNLEEARVIAERLRDRVATTRFPNRQVTVSIGITGASSSRDTAEKIISAADKALFEAKRRGRNNVQTFEYVRKDLEMQE